MTDYVAITDTQIDPDAPLTSQLAYQWRDNPIAMAEGADGAPRFARKIIRKNANLDPVSGMAGYQGCRVDYNLVDNSGASSGYIEFSGDGGSTWPARHTIYTFTDGEASRVSGTVYYQFSDGHYIIPDPGSGGQGTVANMPATVNRMRFYAPTALGSGIVIYPDGGESTS